MKNYVQEGEVLDVTLSGTVASGDMVVVGDLVGVAASGGVSGDKVAVHLEGVYTLPKVNGAITLGAKLYSNGSGSVTTAADNGGSPAVANVWVGWAWTAATSGATSVDVKLKGC